MLQPIQISGAIMPASLQPSYVLGNSWQLHELNAGERAALDRAPFVCVCNLFPEHWRRIGFRPTVWVMGDTYNPPGCDVLARQLAVIRDDHELRSRLRHIFVCIESAPAREIVAHSGLPVTLYRRGDWTRRGQVLARNLDETIYHYGSTLTDVVNLALILNPRGEVRLAGCQYGTRSGHFYHSDEAHDESPPIFPLVVRRMWEGISDLRCSGVPLIDCNHAHGPEMPEEFHLPRGLLFPAHSTEFLTFTAGE